MALVNTGPTYPSIHAFLFLSFCNQCSFPKPIHFHPKLGMIVLTHWQAAYNQLSFLRHFSTPFGLLLLAEETLFFFFVVVLCNR